jgi:imidazolonepropionase-like amidohydrolase
VIRDVTLVSPERAAPLEQAYVRIVDGRIADVSQRPLRGDREVDGAGRFLVPGLIDSHVHLVGQVPGMTFGQADVFPALAAAARRQEPRSYLFFGFTTLLDLNATAGRIAAWNDADVRPDALFCGAAPVANGFPMNVIPAEFRFTVSRYFLYDPRQADRIPASINPAAHTPAAVVKRVVSDGGVCVKAHYEPGGPASGPLPTPTLDMFKALVSAAQSTRTPVVIHANVKAGHRMAVDAGADVVTHTMADALDPDGRLTRDADEILRDMAARGIGYQPTVQALHGALALLDEAYLRDARLGDAVPPALLAWFSTDDGGRYRAAMLAGAGGQAAFTARMADRQRSYARVLARLIALKARLVFGSDTPATASYGNVPGLNGRLEMDRLVEAGVSAPQLFRALTIDNARAFRLDGHIGSVEAGKRAHLLLLRANPLTGVAAYDTIEQVILGGRLIARDTLSARNGQ